MDSLKRKTLFTAISRLLNTVVGFSTQILITPMILSALGQYLYGVYSLINKAEGYMSFVDLRPSAILRYKLAYLQGDNNQTEKRRFVGASIYLSIISLPIILLVGVILCYFFPLIFNIGSEYIKLSRTAVILVAVFLGLKSFLGIPEAILRGNNLEYKGIFIEPIRNIVYIVLIYVTLKFDYGIIGVVFASFASFLIAFIQRLFVQLRFTPGFSPLKPEKRHISEFSVKGGWYLFSSFSFQLLQSLDVLIIGLFFNPVLVTVFTLTKTLSFRVSESVVVLGGSMSSGLGRLIGDGNISALKNVRLKLLRLNLIIGVVLFMYFYFFNEAFISLWVGEKNFSGFYVNLVICLTVPFIILSMTTQLFIDAYLKFKEKSVAVFIASFISIALGIILVKILGLLGIAIAILIGRVWLWLQFEYLLNKEISLDFFTSTFLKSNLGIIVLIAFCSVMSIFFHRIEADSWFEFIWKSAAFMLCLAIFVVLFVIDKVERRQIYQLISRKDK